LGVREKLVNTWRFLYAASAVALALSLIGYFAWKTLFHSMAHFFLVSAGVSGALCGLCMLKVKRSDHVEAVHLAKVEQGAEHGDSDD